MEWPLLAFSWIDATAGFIVSMGSWLRSSPITEIYFHLFFAGFSEKLSTDAAAERDVAREMELQPKLWMVSPLCV